MPAFEDVRLEAFAKGLAEGLSPRAANAAADYKSGDVTAIKKRMARADVAERTNEIRRRIWAREADLATIIEALLELADDAKALKSAAGIAAGRGILTDVARLKSLLPTPAAPEEELPPPMTEAEWLAAFGPLIQGRPQAQTSVEPEIAP